MCIQIINTCATVGIFFLGWYQLYQMREESKRDRTLNICFSYDSNPVISAAVEKYRNKKELTEHDKNTILNYFDVIALGVTQNSYEFKIVYSQFKNIIPKVSQTIKEDNFEEDFPDLVKLIEKIDVENKKYA